MDPITLALGLSLHAGLEHNYNGVHPHIRYQNEQLISGFYYNSVDKISFYVGYRQDLTENLSFEAALATGYPEISKLAPFARFTYDASENTRYFIAPTGEYVNSDHNFGLLLGVEFLVK